MWGHRRRLSNVSGTSGNGCFEVSACPPEFRRQLVELVRSGRTPEELAREFEPTAQSISTGVKQAERDAGKRADGPTSAEPEGTGPSTP
jgi:transposase-like protein